VARVAQTGANVAATPVATRPLIVADAIAFYVRTIVAPLALAPDYGRDPRTVLSNPTAVREAMGVLIALAALAILRWREDRGSDGREEGPLRAAPAGAALSFAAVAPVLGFVPFDFQRYSTVADHYLYLAMIGPALLFAWVLARWPRTPVRVAGLVLLAAF